MAYFWYILMSHREGEADKLHFQTDRFFCVGSQWFFATREDPALGPFLSRGAAVAELLIYARHMNEGGAFAKALIR
jgi:uncharacterized protein DUF6316